MTINLSVPEQTRMLKPHIMVIGVGGAGGNAVNNMITSHLEGVDFLVANTDAQSLAQTHAEQKIQLGRNITSGLGAGSRPDIGRAAAEEAIEELAELIKPAHMLFITAGMGGGTGTGAAPVIARMAREHDILTVGVVTKPFQFEGANRMRLAEAGIEELQQFVDTLIIIPNQNLFRVATEKTTFADAFSMADEVLHSGVRGVTDLMVVPGLINLDFADIRTVMGEMGKAMMGTGEAEGDERARGAAEAAISNPLLDEMSMKGARGVLINITGGPDMTLFEVDEAANRIGQEVDSDANIIFGSTMNESLENRMRVSVVATGIDSEAPAQQRPVLRVLSPPAQPRRPAVRERTERDDAPVDDPPAAAEDRPARPVAVASVPRPTPVRTEAEPDETVEAGPAGADRGEQTATSAVPVTGLRATRDDRPAGPAAPAARAKLDDAGLRATRDDAFIPPPPVEPRNPPGAAGAADPFDEAALVNAGEPERGRRRGPNLLQRMTGAGRARRDDPVADATPDGAMPANPVDKPRPVQARLDDAAPAEPSRPAEPEEDLLDIPAFLRRQAN